jgi:hypothetical protein
MSSQVIDRLKIVFMPKNIANLVIKYHLCVVQPIQSLIYIWVHKPSCTRFILEWIIAGHDFSGPRLRSWSFHFCVSIFLLAFYLCIVYPRIGDLTNLTGYPPLKSNIIFRDYLLDHNLSLRTDHQFKEACKTVPRLKISSISPKEKYFWYLPYLSPLCPRTSNV